MSEWRRAVAGMAIGAIVVTSGAGHLAAQVSVEALSKAAKGCTIDATSVSFGDYDVFDTTPAATTGSITYQCRTGHGVKDATIEISTGRSGSFDRAMFKGTERLRYNLYLDAAHQRIWGDGTRGTQTYSDPKLKNKRSVTLTIFALAFAGQDVSDGAYQDSVMVTILF